MEYAILIILICGIILIYSSINKKESENPEKRLELEKDITSKEERIKTLESEKKVLEAKVDVLQAMKDENTRIKERLAHTETDRNELKNENTSLKKEEENRIKDYKQSTHSINTLKEQMENDRKRLGQERINEIEERMEKMKKKWGTHEKDVEQHIQMICKSNVIEYIKQEEFPYSGKKPDNTIQILEQYIIFDAKSPANDDLSNFPRYIKSQTENLKKYAKHKDVKNELFLVIPSNTLHVIDQFTYNMGDYHVYIITKDGLEPIIMSLQKIEEYEFADKLSPEERDNICRIIGKFAHSTKRRIQIDQFFAMEFLDTLQKAKSHLPQDILDTVVDFEKAEKLNPPMDKRNKIIEEKDIQEKGIQINKEIEIRDIPEIEAKITFKETKGNEQE